MFDFPNSPTKNQQTTGSGGQVYTYDGTKWVATSGAGGGTVTSITAGTGLTGGTITTAGTIALPTMTSSGTYTNLNATIDAQGRVTSAATGTGGTGGVTSLTAGTGLTGGTITTTGTIAASFGTAAGTIAQGNDARFGTIPGPATVAPLIDVTTAVVGTSTLYARQDHQHPTDTTRAPLASPTFTGTVTIPAGAAIAGYAPLASPTFTGTVTIPSGASIAGYALLASPVFSGTPNMPTGTVGVTQTAGTNTTALATCQFVQTATAALPAAPNYVDNAGFAVNQRGYATGTALASGAFGHDRWKGGASGCTYTFTQSGGPATTITITAGSLQQVVEGLSLVGGNYMLSWTGTAQGRTGAGTYAASPVALTGIAAGANTTIEFNAGTLTQVKLESGTVATPWRADPAQQTLARCQRFYQFYNSLQDTDYGTAGMTISMSYIFPVMRAAPTVTFSGTSYNNASAIASENISVSVFDMYASVTAAGFARVTSNAALSADI